MAFFEFDQNNSGGRFTKNDETGIGPRVWIEAANKDDACARAERLGIYFDGVAIGRDCECCGDRWSEPWDADGKVEPEISTKYDFNWHDTVYVHLFDGTIKRLKKPTPVSA